MNERMRSLTLILGVAVLGTALAQADELASAEKQILENWHKLRSMRAKLIETETTEAKGNKATKRGKGTYEFVRKGDEILSRLETTSAMELKVGDQSLKFDFATLQICDGKYSYELSERVGVKTARKTKPDALRPADLKTFLKTLQTEDDLKLLPEQKVDDQVAFVLEATPKNKALGRPYKTLVYYFSKDHGVLLKQEARDTDGKVVQSSVYSDFEFDVKIDPDRFKFEAPKGVQVQDLTGG